MEMITDSFKFVVGLLIIFIIYILSAKVWMEVAAYIGDKFGIYKFILYIYNKIKALYFSKIK